MKKAIRVAALGASIAVGALTLTACSGGDGGGNGGSGGDSGGRGPFTYVQGKDTSGVILEIAEMWNKEHPDEKVTVKQQTDQADQQFQDLTQHFQQKLDDYDVVSVDVVWTAEFAAKQYLQPLTGDYKLDQSAILPSVLKTGTYGGTQYTAPTSTDSQLLYYRKDLLGDRAVPKTLQEMFDLCPVAKDAGVDCYAGQFAKYEGLTVNFNEFVTSAGGTVVDSAGKPTLNTPEAEAGLQLMVDNFKNGNIPKGAVAYQEQQGLNAFEQGKLMFLNNWPYMVADIANSDQAKDIRDKYGIAGYPGTSAVGGHNLGISAFSDAKLSALDWIKYIQSPEIQKLEIEKSSLAPVLSDLYEDADLTKTYPYLTTLKESLDNAASRPISPYYQGVTQAIQNNVYAALQQASNGQDVDVKSVLSSTADAISAASAG